MPKPKAQSKAQKVKQKPAKPQRTRSESKAPAVASKVNTLLRGMGTAAGMYLGGPVGAKLGGDAASYLSRITGMGDYEVEKNTVLTNNSPPSFSANGDGVRIRHREYLQDLNGSTVFTNQSFLINPGNSLMFPWLSTLASSFEVYQFNGLVIEFKSTSADALNSTNTALGVVILATNYDVLDPKFTAKRQAEAYEFVTSTKPSCSVIHPVECKPGKNVLDLLYVTQIQTLSGLPADADPRLYYMGNTQVMCEGMQAVADIGELWVSYDITFMRPKLPTPIGSQYSYGHWYGTTTASNNFASVNVGSGSTLSGTVVPAGDGFTNHVTFAEAGRYLCLLIQNSAGGISGSYTGTFTGTNVTFPPLQSSPVGLPDQTQVTGNAVISVNLAVEWCIVDVLDPAGTLTLPTLTVSSSTAYDLFVSQISSGLQAKKPVTLFALTEMYGRMEKLLSALPSGPPLLQRSNAVDGSRADDAVLIDKQSLLAALQRSQTIDTSSSRGSWFIPSSSPAASSSSSR